MGAGRQSLRSQTQLKTANASVAVVLFGPRGHGGFNQAGLAGAERARVLDAMVDLPFALPTAVAGITLTQIYAPNGWIGQYIVVLAKWTQATFHPGGWLGAQIHDFTVKGAAYSPLGVFIALTFIGFPFGTIPAGGSEIPTFLSYGVERKLSKHKEEFGTTGAIEGGLVGVSYYDWLIVEMLFVPTALRGHGIGTQLMGSLRIMDYPQVLAEDYVVATPAPVARPATDADPLR